MGKKKELKRKEAGSHLSKTNAPHKTSREKRTTKAKPKQKLTLLGKVIVISAIALFTAMVINLIMK